MRRGQRPHHRDAVLGHCLAGAAVIEFSHRQDRFGIRPRHGASGRAYRRSSRPLSCLSSSRLCAGVRNQSVSGQTSRMGFGPNSHGGDWRNTVAAAVFSPTEPLSIQPSAIPVVSKAVPVTLPGATSILPMLCADLSSKTETMPCQGRDFSFRDNVLTPFPVWFVPHFRDGQTICGRV